MPKFIVPAEMYPGVARFGQGFFRPDSVLEWPDYAAKKAAAAAGFDPEEPTSKWPELPPIKLIPVDDEAYNLMVKLYPKKIDQICEPAGLPKTEAKPVDTMSVRETAAKYGDTVDLSLVADEKPKGRKKGRASDN